MGVYEYVLNETQPNMGAERVQINAPDCMQCETCDIKYPTHTIVSVMLKGGGGTNFVGMQREHVGRTPTLDQFRARCCCLLVALAVFPCRASSPVPARLSGLAAHTSCAERDCVDAPPSS